MEDALRDLTLFYMIDLSKLCLNPYSDGRCSKSYRQGTRKRSNHQGLNPYSDGRCSKRKPVGKSFVFRDEWS